MKILLVLWTAENKAIIGLNIVIVDVKAGMPKL